MATSTSLTIDDFERLPAEIAKNKELVDGELVNVSGNNIKHNRMRSYLDRLMGPWVEERGLGIVVTEQEYDFLGNAHGPDVTFFGPAKAALMDDEKRVQRFIPDLAIEIASPNDTYVGLLRKKDRYLRAGTMEVWLIAPETREILVYTQTEVRGIKPPDTISTSLLPGLTIDLELLFAA